MNIGMITYRKYDENVLLNAHFNVLQLFGIILNDRDFVRFEIFDGQGDRLLSTNYEDVEKQGAYIKVVRVEREEEILGVDYNAYRTPSTIYRTKVRWNVDGVRFRIKKQATEYADNHNRKVAMKIEQFVDRRTY